MTKDSLRFRVQRRNEKLPMRLASSRMPRWKTSSSRKDGSGSSRNQRGTVAANMLSRMRYSQHIYLEPAEGNQHTSSCLERSRTLSLGCYCPQELRVPKERRREVRLTAPST